ncbi:(d)CMP kinase [Mesomycoplasma neurolyticum]|uniref:Cytidylate kinase n=1 Tax=Mesomycoplasma neurolyticum TaxID=2120 RepID=A0A449A5Z9_9BACT|nr:(d)CMP kinase [Mesomycoplasma neurolyticum]VEU59710.1 cytidylate kinase [Mesomycoplasma neurolyticum]
MTKINVAIDGPSGAGKSSISSEIAKKYNLTFVNTGTFYRTIAFYFYLKYGNDLNILKDKDTVLKQWKMEYITLEKDGTILLNGFDYSTRLRNDFISRGASIIGTHKEIRKQIVDFLQMYSKKEKGFIMEGRDTTFSILPHAELKIFLWASPEIRAKRRVKQNKELNISEDYEKVLEAIKQRDFLDENRKIDPLHQTEDSILVDSTNMTMSEVIEFISNLIEEKINVK